MNELIIKQIKELLKEEDVLASLCNITAIIKEMVPDLNWVGFYFNKNEELVLGSFQGKVACTRIPIGKGVCGTSFKYKQLLNIANVHDFPGHIACDNASNSELVLPLIINNKAVGVLDIDSPLYSRFTLEDEETFLEISYLISVKLKD